MPKGVEHGRLPDEWWLDVPVPDPVMPKGVEHPDWARIHSSVNLVPDPVMPKGVEHSKPRKKPLV